jgi:flagellar hook assembly protein FlgD
MLDKSGDNTGQRPGSAVAPGKASAPKHAASTFDAASVPSLTSPVDGAVVAGAVQLSATSAAPKVLFLVNGTAAGTQVDVISGVANTSWPSWGVANGSHTVTVVDCWFEDECNVAPSQAGVTVTNTAPAVTSPVAAQILSGAATFTATAPGGGVAFMIDGVRRGFDSTAPYSLAFTVSSLTDGAHTILAVSCPTSGLSCAGPSSPLVTFTASSLHPRITAVSPSVFSPNADGRLDTAKLTYYLPDTETVRFQVRNAAGTIVRGPSGAGTLTKGTRTLVWNGLLNNSARALNGLYTLELATSRANLRGTATARVTVDRTAPTITSIAGGGTTFYPYPDYFRDIFTAKFTLVERATATLTVRNSSGALVRSLGGTRYAGPATLQWNGKNAAGARVAAGTYYWTLTAQDSAGNRRVSARYVVKVSARRTVTKTATVSRAGSQYIFAGGTSYCADADPSVSDFYPSGVWLLNACESSGSTGVVELAGATYRFTAPAAVSYSSLRLQSYGNSLFSPSTVGVGFTKWGTNGFTIREISVGSTNAWRTIGSVGAAGLVSSGSRLVETTLYVPNDYDGASDYDIGNVRLVVTYKVLG